MPSIILACAINTSLWVVNCLVHKDIFTARRFAEHIASFVCFFLQVIMQIGIWQVCKPAHGAIITRYTAASPDGVCHRYKRCVFSFQELAVLLHKFPLSKRLNMSANGSVALHHYKRSLKNRAILALVTAKMSGIGLVCFCKLRALCDEECSSVLYVV